MRDYKIKIGKTKILYLLIIISMLVIACFSYDMADYQQYMISYGRIANNISTGYRMEFGYIFKEICEVCLNDSSS